MLSLSPLFATGSTALLECLLNYFLRHDPEGWHYLAPLSNKVLQLKLRELATPLTFVFGEQSITILATRDIPFDCCITTQLSLLPKFLDQSQVIPMIRAGELDIEGDLSLLQPLNTLLLHLCKWDPEEWLSHTVGDVLAHSIVRIIDRMAGRARQQAAQQWHWLREMVLEEWRLLPSRAEAVPLTREVTRLECDTLQLEDRLQQLSLALDAQPFPIPYEPR